MNKLKLTNERYDFIKWLIIKVSPALVILISGMGVLFGFDVTVVVGLIGLVTTFLATILNISTKNYEGGTQND